MQSDFDNSAFLSDSQDIKVWPLSLALSIAITDHLSLRPPMIKKLGLLPQGKKILFARREELVAEGQETAQSSL